MLYFKIKKKKNHENDEKYEKMKKSVFCDKQVFALFSWKMSEKLTPSEMHHDKPKDQYNDD